MSKKTGWRLTTPPKIRPEGGRKIRFGKVPPPPLGKFDHCEGQAAMDFSQDEWDALTEPEQAR